MSDVKQYDAIIVGSGQAGTPLARTLAEAGWKAALIEREHIGGTCLNEGCTPTKTMVASADAAALARRAGEYGVQVGQVAIDMGRVRQRKRDVVADFVGSSRKRLEATRGLDLLWGEARFVDAHTLQVAMNDGTALQCSASKIVLDTGTRAGRPPLPGLADVPALDSTSIMELDRVPSHLIVLGGGYVGLEFSQMFCRFGSRVTVVQRSNRLLSREDGDMAQAVADILSEDGVEVLLSTEAQGVSRANGDGVALAVNTPQGPRTIAGSHLLVATGRAPNTQRLNLAAAGVHTDERGFIPVDEQLQTNVEGIYAVGDVNGEPAFTHIAYDDFRILRTNWLGGGHASTTGRMVPYVVFIDPPLGRVGLTEEQARREGCKVKVARLPMTSVARAIEVGETRGQMKAVVDAETGQILGCAVLGIEGGEIMSIMEIAMMGRLPYTALKDAILAHPTLAEALNNLFAAVE